MNVSLTVRFSLSELIVTPTNEKWLRNLLQKWLLQLLPASSLRLCPSLTAMETVGCPTYPVMLTRLGQPLLRHK